MHLDGGLASLWDWSGWRWWPLDSPTAGAPQASVFWLCMHSHTHVRVRGCGSDHGTAGGVGLGLAHGWEVSL